MTAVLYLLFSVLAGFGLLVGLEHMKNSNAKGEDGRAMGVFFLIVG
jgi:hypothetical protein